MKKTLLFSAMLTILAAGCQKIDCNGELDGMWQLTEWKNRADNARLADKTSGIFWCVQLKLMKFERKNSTDTHYFLSRFRHEGDSLFLGDVFASPYDEPAALDKLAPFGVDAEGKFRVETLDDERMVLSNKSSLLTFRRY